ncbi:MAG TPA: GFA family protein [Abditibacteriaceae bacterium]|jgi:hypothetical protein
MYKGSCLCGTVNYEIEGEPGDIVFCHCSRCRKANGTAFLAAAPVQTEQFSIVSGNQSLVEYESSPGVYRVFCGQCGSPLFSKRDAMPETIRVRIGTLDTPIESKPTAHIFVADKANWFDIRDEAPQFPERP